MPGTSFVAHYQRVVAGDYGNHWTARRIDTGHMCMFTALDETVALLAEAGLIDDGLTPPTPPPSIAPPSLG